MEAFIAYAAEHWIEWLFAGITALAGLGYKNVSRRLKEERERNEAKMEEERVRNEAIAEGVQALLRENIVNNYNKYHDKGFCPIYAKESIKKAYKAYAALGGNDVASSLYKKILDMKEEEEQHE